ncbi:unnamed protein product [Calypogeia fissa]
MRVLGIELGVLGRDQKKLSTQQRIGGSSSSAVGAAAASAAVDVHASGVVDKTKSLRTEKDCQAGTMESTGGAAAAVWEEEEEEPTMNRGGELVEATVPFILAESSSANGPDGSGSAGVFYTVEDAIDHLGFGTFQIGMVTYTGLTWLADAAEMILLAFVGPAAKCEWSLSPGQESSISSAVFVGVLLGSYCWGILSDNRGRRYAFLATALFTTVFGLLSAWSPAFWFLLLSRAFVGFGLGGASVAFSLCMEFLPTKGRGFWLVFLEAFWTVGSIAEALLAWIIIPNINWRWLVAVSALPFILLLAFYPVLPESPRYLMMKGDGEGARKILQRIAKANGKSLPPGMLTLLPVDSVPISKHDQSTLPSEEVDTAVDIGGNAKQPSFKPSESSHAGVFDTFKLLFSPELKRSTLLLWFLFFANAFTYYGLVLLTTELQVKGSTLHACKDPSNLGSDDGTECHIDGRPIIETSQYRTVLITCIAELPGLVVACLIVDKFGRKISLAVLLIACGLFSLPLVTPLTEVATNVLMFGSRSCIMGGFSILWAYAPELYYTKVRSTGVGAANSGGRLGGFLCPFVAVGLIESCQRKLSVGLFTVVPIIAGCVVFLFPKETPTRRPKRATPSLADRE